MDDLRQCMGRRDHKKSQRRGDDEEDSARMSRQQQRMELRALAKEARQREKDVVRRIIDRSNVVLCTCITAGSRLLEDVSFDMVVIDEAAQGLEAVCWIPILKGRRCVLAGDHCQLPPTIKSQEAEKGGLGVTLFERIIEDPRFERVVSLLDTQYRMNAKISDWASKHMYRNAIQSHSTVAGHTLSDFNSKHCSHIANESGSIDDQNHDGLSSFPVLLLVDTSGCGMQEDSTTADEGGSHRNYHEADLVLKHVVALVEAGIQPNQIGVITPYNAQLDVLRSLLLSTGEAVAAADGSTSSKHPVASSGESGHKQRTTNALQVDALSSNGSQPLQLEGLEIKTIDGFQGGEKECILLSLVRSNASHSVGFLGEKRRINVAVTRAKRHLAVFCDVGTCSVNPFMRGLLTHMADEGDHISADEYADYIINASGTSDSSSFVSSRSKTIKGDDHKVERCKLDKQDFISLLQRFQQCQLIDLSEKDRPPKAHSQHIDIQVAAASSDDCSSPPREYEVIQVRYLPKDDILRFPSTLTSYQRMLIHECAEELQLHHRSENRISKAVTAGYERFIEVSTREFSSSGTGDALKAGTDDALKTGIDHEGTQRAAYKAKTAKATSSAARKVAGNTTTSEIKEIAADQSQLSDQMTVVSMSDPEIGAQRTNTDPHAVREELNSAKSTPATTTGRGADQTKSAVVEAPKKKKSTCGDSSSTGKVYVSAERQSYLAMMEQQLQDTLHRGSVEEGEEDQLIEAAILHNQVCSMS